jgi:hypothetical protein
MATNIKSAIASSSTRPRRLLTARMIQNFHLVWLDGSIDEANDDHLNSITKLRQFINTVNTFVAVDECIDFIDSIKEERIFMIISGFLAQKTIFILHERPSISAIYIFCGNKERHEKWAKEWPKVADVYTDITHICEALKKD